MTYLLKAPITLHDDSLFVYLETVKSDVKMYLVPQFLTKKFVYSLIRKRKWNSTIACRLFSNFDFVTEISNFLGIPKTILKYFLGYFPNFSVPKAKFEKRLHTIVEKTFLYRMRSLWLKSNEICGTTYIFGDTYFFRSKIFLSFFLKTLIGWNFDSF
jgi:hypothetical protein